MGDPSFLRLVPDSDSSASTSIDWTRIPEASKEFFSNSWGYNRPLPATVGDLAKMFDERKFFGYMDPELCTLLMDISEGLDVQASGMPPRFYMKYLQQIWFVLFLPGKRDGISGYSRDVDIDERIDAEIKVAQEFDVKLTEQFSPGAVDMVAISKKLCGWEATMFCESLESAQYMNAIYTLPSSHRARRDMMQSLFRSF